MPTTLRDEVIAFLRKNAGVNIDTNISDDKTLGDWGIDGADGWELIEEFGKQFEIDLRSFDAGKHFGPECDPITGFVYFVLWHGLIHGQAPRFLDLVPITFRDLVRVAKTKTWTL